MLKTILTIKLLAENSSAGEFSAIAAAAFIFCAIIVLFNESSGCEESADKRIKLDNHEEKLS